jgi:hypothetical protein
MYYIHCLTLYEDQDLNGYVGLCQQVNQQPAGEGDQPQEGEDEGASAINPQGRQIPLYKETIS